MLAYAPTMDRATQEYRFRSGARNTYWIDQLVKYVKAQGLWDAFRFYPFENRTNARTGATAYGLGGLTSDEMTLVNGPTWGASGVDFTVATTYGIVSIPGFQSLTDGYVFTRLEPQAGSVADGTGYVRWWFGDVVGARYLGSGTSTGGLAGETYTTFQESNSGLGDRTGSTTASWTAGEDFTEVCRFGTFGSGAAVYKNKTAFVMDLSSDSQVFTPSGTGYTTNDEILVSGTRNGTVNASLVGVYKAFAVISGTVTDTQRETITDYINLIGTAPPDADVVEFVERSGATDILAITQLVQYAKQEGLWDNMRVYPMVGGTNAGTGSVCYGLGGLTTNEMSLVNGPVWGTANGEGLEFSSASSMYGSITDDGWLGSETLTVILRSTITASGSFMISQYDNDIDEAWSLRGFGDSTFGHNVSQDGTTNTSYKSTSTGNNTDASHVSQFLSDGSLNYWVDKSLQSSSIIAGSALTGRNDSSANITLNSLIDSGSASLFSDQTAHALAFLTGTVTTTQRETITDLINAL